MQLHSSVMWTRKLSPINIWKATYWLWQLLQLLENSQKYFDHGLLICTAPTINFISQVIKNLVFFTQHAFKTSCRRIHSKCCRYGTTEQKLEVHGLLSPSVPQMKSNSGAEYHRLLTIPYKFNRVSFYHLALRHESMVTSRSSVQWLSRLPGCFILLFTGRILTL
jgi:hypothetical protein